MKKFIDWHQNLVFKFMVKLNLGVYEIAWISWVKGLILGAILTLLCSCGTQFQYGLLNSAGNFDAIYGSPKNIVIEVSDTTQVDTILSFYDLKHKLRTDFNFRWDFAQYAMNQPYSWYWNNPRLDGIWRPYNRFDVYFNSHYFWTDWAWNYPFNYNSWGWYNWNRPYYYGWYQPYRPWNNWYNGPWYNQNYNIVWNASRRGSLVSYSNLNRINNISTTIQNRRNSTRNIINQSNLANYYKPPVNINNDQIIEFNTRTNWSTQSNSNGRGRGNWQNIPTESVRPIISNPVQPRQIRGGSGSPVFQQTKSSYSPSGQGRSSRGGGRN